MRVVPPSAPFTSGVTVGTQPPLRRVRWLLRLGRLAGFDVAWTVDHFLGFFPRALWNREFTWVASPDGTPHAFFDYQTLLGRLAADAGSIRLGVGVTEPIRRHPVLIAQFAMTLAHLTKRPPILGIGAGERENIEPYGLDFTSPVSQLEEALQVIRLCFERKGPIDFEGRYYRLENAFMDLEAPRARTPEVWVAAHGPRMLQLTGRFGDGWYPTFPMTAGEFEDSLSAVQQAARESGRDPASIVPGWQAFAVVARTEAAARALLDNKAIRFTALLTPAEIWRRYGVDHPFGDRFRGLIDFVPPQYTTTELDDAIARVPVDVLAEGGLVGTPDQIFNRLTEYVDAGLRHLVLQPGSGLASRTDAVYSLRAVSSIQRRLRRMSSAPRAG